MTREALEPFFDTLVKIVYRDGDRVEVKHGYLIEVFPEFISIETKKNDYLLHKDQIIKIQTSKKGDSHEK
ncbi:hypothetical protein AKJ41_03220 [candidate division MSBL1 archaeon SCGC-AAA259O05]|uniref:Uncharacterized protein n=1 Tax=candidate division MSBL1 archaeon SCGC-AAA259O05 TaxID=1698271 RepID=A0A133V3G5_9EURY|nr:hypothetical protein AKJ41_03220 [candidate division MSBL1 archaeon SCGC-AAA259O05]